jgi:hypothetical protein
VIKFYSTPANRKFRQTIQNSIVLHDELSLGSIYIQTHLNKLFNIPGWSWVARALPNKKYLIKPPNKKWKDLVLSQGEIVLRDVRFVAELYNFRKFDGDSDLVIIWVNIIGMSPDLWKEEEFRHIVTELEGFYVDVDPQFWEHIDLTILRIIIGVKFKEVILLYHNMLFTDDSGNHRFLISNFKWRMIKHFIVPANSNNSCSLPLNL